MDGKSHNLLSVIVPCYNETATIAEVVGRIMAQQLPGSWKKEIIVVDDGSSSQTKGVLQNLPAVGGDSSVRVIYKQYNEGKGAAVKEGLKNAGGELCIIQDSDLELDPSDYPALMSPILAGQADSVFGYRVLRGDSAAKPTALFYGGHFLTYFYNFVFSSDFRDIPCCYKIFPQRFIGELLLSPNNDFVFDAVDLTYVLHHGGRVTEVPVSYAPRSRNEGKKIRWSHGIYSALAIIMLRFGFKNSTLVRDMPKFLRFAFTGMISLAVNLAILAVFLKLGAWYISASALAFLGSWVINFFMHKFWTFSYQQSRKAAHQALMHLCLMFFNLGINIFVVYLLVGYASFNNILAQIIAAFVIMIESYLISAKVIFREK